MSIGQGSISLTQPPLPAGAIAIDGARNGLSVDTGSFIVLGQDVGAGGDPAKLLSNREIPLQAFSLNLRGTGTLVLSDTALAGDGSKLRVQRRTAGNGIEVDAEISAGGSALYSGSLNGVIAYGLSVIPGAFPSVDLSLIDPTTGDILFAAGGNDSSTGTGVINYASVSAHHTLSSGPTTRNAFQDFSVINNSAGTNSMVSFSAKPEIDGSTATDTIVGFEFVPTLISSTGNFIAWRNSVGNIFMGTSGGTQATRVAIRNGTAATAWLHLGAGAAAASSAPLKLTNGTLQTTAEAGAIEFNTLQLFFTPAAATRQNIVHGSAAAAPASAAIGVFTTVIGSATVAMGAPVNWLQTVIGGTTFKIPLYTP
jgi:hypothetical protein